MKEYKFIQPIIDHGVVYYPVYIMEGSKPGLIPPKVFDYYKTREEAVAAAENLNSLSK